MRSTCEETAHGIVASGAVVEHDVLLAVDLERQLDAGRARQRERPWARREHDGFAGMQLPVDADAAHPSVLHLDRLDPRALPRLAAEPAHRGDVGLRRGDGVGEAGVRLVERVRDPVCLDAREQLLEVLDVERVEPLPVLHLRVRHGELRIRLVDEEEPAGAVVDRVALEVERHPPEELARVHRHAHHLGVRVVAADDRGRLARRLARRTPPPRAGGSARPRARAPTPTPRRRSPRRRR